RAEEQDRDRELLHPVRMQTEVLLHEEHRAADDARVVAEEEAADRRDQGDAQQAPVAKRLADEPGIFHTGTTDERSTRMRSVEHAAAKLAADGVALRARGCDRDLP